MQALEGIRILDLTRILAGPYCTQLLGDFGADVIKVEQPGSGDGTRQWGPPWVGELAAYYLCANRNKRSLTLDLKAGAGKDILRKLIAQSDVLIENFLPGTMDRLGFGFDALHKANPRLIVCSISGYGQTGPNRDKPGYDFAIQAESGLMSITGEVDGEPSKVGVAIADVMTGLFAANAIQTALLARERSGRGQHIDIALMDAMMAGLINVAQNHFASGRPPKRYGNAHANLVPYQAFATQDGHLALAVGSDEQFRKTCEVLGRPDLPQDARFAKNPGRVTHREALIAEMQKAFVTQPTQHWIARIEAAGVPVSTINTVDAALKDAQVRQRGMVREVHHPTQGPISLLGPVAHMSETPPEIQRAPPTLGEHTDEILLALGCDKGAIAALREAKVV